MNKLLFFLILSLPLHAKELYVIEGDSDSSELFSAVDTVLALLDLYDKGECGGVEVAFNKNGKYYEKSKGPNWWNYYFEPLHLGEGSEVKVPNYKKRILSLTTQFEMPQERAYALFSKYLKVNASIQEKVDSFFGEGPILGVFYHRSTEKELQPVVSYEEVLQVVQRELEKMPSATRLFLVTQEEKLQKALEEHYPVITYKEKGSAGEKELIQALLLSKADTLIRTSNTFSKGITQLNPKISCVDLDKNWQEKE